jgi:putative transposase
MSRQYYSEINLHLVWHTKNSLPLLTEAVEPLAYRELRRRIVETPGAYVHAIGGTPTHVHLAVTVPPTLLASDFVGKLKGGASHDVNHQGAGNSKRLQWQGGYGVVSFGTRDLPWVVAYIENQREHHARGTVHERLERVDEEEDGAGGSSPVNGGKARERA